MKCRNHLEVLIGASILGLATAALAPRLYGGGGDEGVDILPFTGDGGASGAGDEDGPSDPPPRPPNGYLTIHGDDLTLDANDSPYASGFLAGGHTRADIFFGMPGDEPYDDATGLDILGKGTRALFFSDVMHGSGVQGLRSFVHFNGRFEFEDIDEDDGELLELAGRKRLPAVLGIVVGKRSTHEGGIWKSFAHVDQFVLVSLPTGAFDLEEARKQAKANLAGTGLDVGFVLYATTARGADQVWAAFNVDDARAIYDVEVKLR